MKTAGGFFVLVLLALVLASTLSSQVPVLDHFQCYKIKASRGNLCAAESPNPGAECETEEACGGTEDITAYCVPNRFPKHLRVSLF